MLTRNDRCFFALAFYRQTVTWLFFGMGKDPEADERLVREAKFWWDEYRRRRAASRL